MDTEIYKDLVKNQTDEQLIQIVENSDNLEPALFKAAQEEINNRGGIDFIKLKTQQEKQAFEITNPSSNEIKDWKKKRKYIIYAIIGVALLFLLLSFHFVPENLMMFPKDSFSFNNTIIFQSDIDALLKKYNDASIFDKMIIVDEPLFKKLKEKGLIYFIDETNQNSNSSQETNSSSSEKSNTESTYSDEDKKMIEKIKAKAKRDYPNDFTVQKMMYDQAVEDYFYMKTASDVEIKKNVERDYPLEFTTQKMMYNQEVDSKEQMK